MEALGINIGYLILQLVCFAGLVIGPLVVVAAAFYFWFNRQQDNSTSSQPK